MKQTISLLVLSILLFASCKKNQTGGKSEVKGTVFHHSKRIPEAIVYIKFNATEFPGKDVSVYDDKVIADSEGNYTVKFYKGSYYLYAVGKDYAIPAPYEVVGGVPIKLRTNEEINTDIYVTEGD
ncbi:MAG: hypothetical protein J0L69_16455 [Bacteroidetes bacterium]|nr:hypothetical protein [Bacteroidota bacterium]